jgi:chromate transporter
MLARGRLGGLLAGLGFMLPGFVLMFLLSWLYVAVDITASATFAAAFAGVQPAVGATIVRAVHRIGSHTLTDRWLWALAIIAGLAQLAGVHFAISLAAVGLAYVLTRRRQPVPAAALAAALLVAAAVVTLRTGDGSEAATGASEVVNGSPSQLALFWSGLRSGLLTFGGAYTVIPFLQHDAVERGRWMTDGEFLDGLALSGILPAPLIIFATFVGYLGGGALGAVVLTVGIFLPAFAFTLVGHDLVEHAVTNRALHAFLDGVTAGVVGLITATTLGLLRTALDGPIQVGIFAAALVILFRWNVKYAVAAVILGAALAGLLLLR